MLGHESVQSIVKIVQLLMSLGVEGVVHLENSLLQQLDLVLQPLQSLVDIVNLPLRCQRHHPSLRRERVNDSDTPCIGEWGRGLESGV